jgi:site-specific recombinase XerD
MKLNDVISQYITLRQSLGVDFKFSAELLRRFGRLMGAEIDIAEVRAEEVKAFLDGERPLTRYWEVKYSALHGLYDYAIGRGLASSSPLPLSPPKCPASQKPYIYTREELRRLLDATDSFRNRVCLLEPQTLRTLLLLLYGAGLRVSEALALNQADVDLSSALLTIRDTKFYKTRLVPLGAELNQVLTSYHSRRPNSTDSSQPFFTGKDGSRLIYQTVRQAFRQLRNSAGVHRHDNDARYQPRLHDLRHSFAVHRLVSWYQSGADVQKLLPHLSTYLGHVHLRATQVYLTMTPELLEVASERFAEYVFKEVSDD